ncbi:unnamed protein product, partial [Brassica rapa subsp. trilocularis]
MINNPTAKILPYPLTITCVSESRSLTDTTKAENFSSICCPLILLLPLDLQVRSFPGLRRFSQLEDAREA